MKQSVLQSNLILSVREDSGLTPARMRRLIACGNVKAAVKILLEAGYGESMPKENTADFNALINRELNTLIKNFEEINPDEVITHCFLSEFLYHNAKVFYKQHSSGAGSPVSPNPAALYSYGTEIKDGIAKKNYGGLPRALSDALYMLDERAALSPLEIDVEIDKAYYLDVWTRLKKSKNSLVKKYFSARIDLINISSLYRARLLGLPFHAVFKMLLADGSGYDFEEIYTKSISEWAHFFEDAEYSEAVAFLADGKKAEEAAAAFEIARESYLTDIFKKNIGNYFKADGIIYYYLSKRNELKAVRMIMTFISNGLDKKMIEKRVGGLNGNNG